MPWRISREAAIARATAEHTTGGCLMCAILAGRAGPVWVVGEGEHTVSLLSRYPRSWGQTMVVLRRHVTTFSALTPAEWQEATAEAHRVAARIEDALSPLRCYIASLGTWREDLPLSCPHLHVHIDPVYDPQDRPRTVFTHAYGVMDGTEAEWAALAALLR